MRGEQPVVSVLMSVHNSQEYLHEAIESILNQTFRDFEFIIIDDGSTDGTRGILERYQKIDARIRVYSQDNRGLIASLNRGCQLAKGKFIARMDADDISLPHRFEKQIRLLERHPEIGICGTLVVPIDRSGRPLQERKISFSKTTSSARIRWTLLFYNCVKHPSTMIRREVLPEGDVYRAQAVQAEDYDLWMRLMFTTRIVSLPDRLLLVRRHDQRISVRHGHQQERTAVEITQRGISRLLGREVARNLAEDLRHAFWTPTLTHEHQVRVMKDLIRQLHAAFNAQFRPTFVERQQVAEEAAMMLLRLARTYVSLWPAASLEALVEAVSLSPAAMAILPLRVLGGLYDDLKAGIRLPRSTR